MARLARIVVPGLPHHVTARGNRREPIFFAPGDQQRYAAFLAKAAREADVEVWAYCLMPNHVHLILTPKTTGGLSRAIGAAHRQWASFVNERAGWSGHLFQDRFACVAMDQRHLMNAVRYVAMNPVRARLCASADAWPWSSVRAHLAGKDDGLVVVRYLLDLWPDFRGLLEGALDADAIKALRAAEFTGRPLGSADFIAQVEQRLGRSLAKRTAGPKPRLGVAAGVA